MKGKRMEKIGSYSLTNVSLLGIFMALTCVVTMSVHIPVPGTKGYLNPGDIIVLWTALSMGKKPGALVGGIGSAMADLFLGYTHYVPITLIVKGLEGYVSGLLYEKTNKKLPSLCLGAFTMAIGYFIPESYLYGKVAAGGSFLPNLGQGLFGVFGAIFLHRTMGRYFKEFVRN